VVKTVDSPSESLPLRRLVVRVKIPVEQPPATPARPPLNRTAVLLAAVVVAALLAWLGIRMFASKPTPATVATEVKPIVQPQPATPLPSPPEAAPVITDQPVQVIPTASRGALNTISGTIRVSISVIVAKDGTVTAANVDEPGPSRYFARLAAEAAKQWTFAPSDTEDRRIKVIRFYFKRSGVTARLAE
jgi:TonB family protein